MKANLNLEWLRSLIPNENYKIELFYKGESTGWMHILESKIIFDQAILMLSFNPITWEKTSIKADSAIIYQGNSKISKIDFDKEYQSINGDFTIKFPEDLIRIG